MFLLAYARNRYVEMIRKSTFSFACGSAMGMALRKYFEIPANSSILVCEKIPSLEWLGFQNGENCLTVSRSSAEQDIDNIMTMPCKALTSICKRGWNHVLENHSVWSRAATIKEYVF